MRPQVYGIRVLLTGGVLLLTSCLTTIRPLSTPQNISVNDQVTGVWKESGKSVQIRKLAETPFQEVLSETQKSNAPFSPVDSVYISKHYIITYKENNLEYTWVASIVSIDKQQFVSITAEDCLSADGKDMTEGKSTYSIAKLDWEGKDNLVLRFLNGESIKKWILEGKMRIKNEYDPLFGTFIITASAADLEQFLEKYGLDERIYKGGKVIRLVR